MQGKIACANVLSDLYACGVSECDNMLMLLGISQNLTLRQREVVAPLVIQGFIGGRGFGRGRVVRVSSAVYLDLCEEAGSSCNGGQTVLNPWFIIGGVASSVSHKSELIKYVI